MIEYFQQSAVAQLVLYMTILLVLCVVGYYLLQRFRDSAANEAEPVSEIMSNFREVHKRGGLSDAEYRTIKAVVGEQLKEKLSDKLSDAEETT